MPEFYGREGGSTGDAPPQTLKQATCWDGAADAGQTMGAGKGAKGQQSDLRHPDVIVVDPPRKGCDERCLETMLKRDQRALCMSVFAILQRWRGTCGYYAMADMR